MNKIKLSLLVSTYNVEKYIENTIRSLFDKVLPENIPKIELLIADDLSTDGTVSVIKNVVKEIGITNFELIVLKEKSFYAGKGFNVLLEKCKGRYVHIIDGDDLFNSNLYNELLYFEYKEDIIQYSFNSFDYLTGEIFYTSLVKDELVDSNNYEYSIKIHDDMISNRNCSSKIFSKSFISDTKFIEDRASQDSFFVSRLLEKMPSIRYCSSILLYYCIGKPSTSNRINLKGFDDKVQDYNDKNEYRSRFLPWLLSLCLHTPKEASHETFELIDKIDDYKSLEFPKNLNILVIEAYAISLFYDNKNHESFEKLKELRKLHERVNMIVDFKELGYVSPNYIIEYFYFLIFDLIGLEKIQPIEFNKVLRNIYLEKVYAFFKKQGMENEFLCKIEKFKCHIDQMPLSVRTKMNTDIYSSVKEYFSMFELKEQYIFEIINNDSASNLFFQSMTSDYFAIIENEYSLINDTYQNLNNQINDDLFDVIILNDGRSDLISDYITKKKQYFIDMDELEENYENKPFIYFKHKRTLKEDFKYVKVLEINEKIVY